MGSWPFTRLHFGCSRCIAISGPFIQVFDATSGQILATTRCATNTSCSVVDKEYTHLITADEDKRLSVWEINGLRLKSSRELPKKATAVQLSHNGQAIIVADKFGDVFSYPIDPPSYANETQSHSSEPRRKDAQAAHENPYGSLVLGHASIITSFLLSHDGRYIITADRDEHIRVSSYPNGYNVERYCLGHQLFISTICLPAFEPSSLVSGGGDPSMNVWDWMTGTLKCQLPVADAVKPFLKVRQTRNKWHGAQDTSSGARGRKGRNKRGNAKESTEEVNMVTAEPLKASGETVAERKTEEDLVFALAKVEALECRNEKLLVFSAIGGSALFYCAYPSQASNTPFIRHVDFSSPILDFVLGDEFQVLVSVDAGWSLPLTPEGTVGTAVRLVEWIEGDFKIVEDNTPLINSLNGAGLQEASAAELTSLALYSDLALLPKHADGPEEGGGIGDQDSDMRADTPELSQSDLKKQHAKVMGRMKTKQALLKRQELDKGSSRSTSGDEREPKKLKLQSELS